MNLVLASAHIRFMVKRYQLNPVGFANSNLSSLSPHHYESARSCSRPTRIALFPVRELPGGLALQRHLNEVIRSVWRLRRPTAGPRLAAVPRTGQFHSMLSGQLANVDRRFCSGRTNAARR